MGKTATRAKPAPAGVSAAVKEITRALSMPFDMQEVKFKPAVVSGNRALALAYVDARVIQDRLDEVLGVEGWQDSYKVLEDGTVVCRLTLRLGEQWVTKMDVGSPSDQGDSGDRRKAAFSDALKRAAVKFGLGRYLYRLPTQWVDYDPHKKQITRPPQLPPWALPTAAVGDRLSVNGDRLSANGDRPAAAGPKPKTVAEPPAEGHEPKAGSRKPAAESREPKAESRELKAESRKPGNLPANGVELQRRLYDYDAKLAKEGVCAQGDLVRHVVDAGVKAGYEADLSTWNGEAMLLAAEATKSFETRARTVRKQPQREVA